MGYLEQAVKYLDIEARQVTEHRETETEIILLVDRGIKGITKHTFNKADLDIAEREAKKVDRLKERLATGQPEDQAETEAKKVDRLKRGKRK
jgi:hypothetical protein